MIISKETISFGGYDWLVLDEQNGMMFIITKNITAYRQYNTIDTSITWENCDLRNKYLKNEFYNSFTLEDKQHIVTTTILNENNQFSNTHGGNATQDEIFILSLSEYVHYFCDDTSVRQLADKDMTSLCEIKYYPASRQSKDDKKSVAIWLRSPGIYDNSVVYVNSVGCIKAGGDRINRTYGVRPALWLKTI